MSKNPKEGEKSGNRCGNKSKDVRVWRSQRRKIISEKGSVRAADGRQKQPGDVTASTAFLTSAAASLRVCVWLDVIYMHICR